MIFPLALISNLSQMPNCLSQYLHVALIVSIGCHKNATELLIDVYGMNHYSWRIKRNMVRNEAASRSVSSH